MTLGELVASMMQAMPDLDVRLGLPAGSLAIIAPAVGRYEDELELERTLTFRRHLVIELVRGQEANLDADPKGTAKRIVELARAVEAELERQRPKRETRKSVGELLAQLHNPRANEPQPERRDLTKPWPDLDASIEVESGAVGTLRFGPQQRPARVDRLHFTSQEYDAASLYIISIRVGGEEQLALPPPADSTADELISTGMSLLSMGGRNAPTLVLPAARIGALIEVDVKNISGAKSRADVRLGGWIAPRGDVP